VCVAPSAKANDWETVAALARLLRVVLDPWQELVLQVGCGVRADGKWAATDVGLSVPRQNGKTLVVSLRIVAGALYFGEKNIIVSAHLYDTVAEIFNQIVEWSENCSEFAATIAPGGIYQSLARNEIRFKNGARVQFKSRRKGRGFSADLLVLDEAQILARASWARINSTRSARFNPQVWLLGTPPGPEDDGEVFGSVRESAIAGKEKHTAWVEWGAEPEDDPYDIEILRKANPAWDTRINPEIVASERASYTPMGFGRERLGIWYPKEATCLWQIFTEAEWDAATFTVPPTDGVRAFAVKFSLDGKTFSVAGALKSGESTYVESLGVWPLSDTGPTISGLMQRQQVPVFVDGRGAAQEFQKRLAASGFPKRMLHPVSTEDAVIAYAGFYRATLDGEAFHSPQPGLMESVKYAGWRKIGEQGGQGYKPVNPNGDVTAIEAVALAFGAVQSVKPKKSQKEWRAII
jgi:hypothetical protein